MRGGEQVRVSGGAEQVGGGVCSGAGGGAHGGVGQGYAPEQKGRGALGDCCVCAPEWKGRGSYVGRGGVR